MRNALCLSSLALTGALLSTACGEVVLEPGRSSSSGSGNGGSGAGGGNGGALPTCEALESTTPEGVSRWLFEHAALEAVVVRDATLVDTGLEGEDTTLLLALAKSANGDVVLLASRFDGRKAPEGDAPVLLARKTIPLPGGIEPTRFQATRGAAGKVGVLLTSDTSSHLLWIDAQSLQIEEDADLGGGADPLFFVARADDFLIGLQPQPTPSQAVLVSKTHPSLALALPIGCPGGHLSSSAAPNDEGFLVGINVGKCPLLGDDGFYVLETIDGSPVGAPRRVDLDFEVSTPVLIRSGERIWAAIEDTHIVTSGVHAVALDLHGSPAGDARTVTQAMGSFPAAGLGATAVVGDTSGQGVSMSIAAMGRETIGYLNMGVLPRGQLPWPSLMNIAAMGNDTLLATWGYSTTAPEGELVHLEQLRCTSSQ